MNHEAFVATGAADLQNKRPNGSDVDVELQAVVDNVSATVPIAAAEATGSVPTVRTSSNDEKEEVIVEVEIIPKGYSLIRFPKEKSCFRKIMWFVIWPIHFLFMLTIPDCERPSLKKLFPITFLMCIVWIGSLSYMVAWMITIIGKWCRAKLT